MAYTGPVPPTPTADTPASDPKWTNYWAYQTQLFRDADIVARNDNTAAIREAARVQGEMVKAYLAPAPAHPAPTDAQLLLSFISDQLEAGRFGPGVLAEAKAQLSAYKAATAKPIPAPK